MEEFNSDPVFARPGVVQFSVFLDNRVGQLGKLLELFVGTDVQLAAVSVLDSADCAIVRCVLVPSDEARGVLASAGMSVSETEMVVAELGSPDALRDICRALLAGEINIHYAYPLIIKPHGDSAVALHVDEPELAARILARGGFVLLGEKDMT